MFNRILGIPVLLGAAVAVPYFSTNGSEDVKRWWASSSAASNIEDLNTPSASHSPILDPPHNGPGHEIYPIATPLEGEPRVALEEVFRFDVTKEWVYARWPRKSTALSQIGLYGVRVPLVTGTEIHDLAGSLTYFFDSSGSVQRITFKGNTGDTTKVLALAQHHGLQPQASPIVGEQLLQIKSGNDVYSELHTRPMSVLWSSAPHDSFAVNLDIQRPGTTTPLPPRVTPLPEVKPAPEATAEKTEEEVENKKKGFQESMKSFFPRSRVPSSQVESLEKRDRMW